MSLSLFHIRREERGPAVIATLWLAVMNSLMISKFWTALTTHPEELQHALRTYYHVSGFDSYTYLLLTDWDMYYDVVRHPLLPYLLYPAYLINQLLTAITGQNMALPLVAVGLTFCGLCSFILLFRIMREVIGIRRGDAALLSALFFAMAYILMAFVVPDHFALSLTLLLLTFYITGRQMRAGRLPGAWQTAVLFIVTAGTTLTNGAKVFLATLFARKVKFFRWRFLLAGVVIPAALVTGCCWLEYRAYVLPKEQAEQQQWKKHRKEMMAQARKNHQKYKNAPWVIHKGKALGQDNLLKWTDISTPRWASVVENLWGESFQFHQTHMLEDVLVFYRPVLLRYSHWWNYAAEALLALLFLAGIWAGRRSRFLWALVGCTAIDMVMHIGLGFAINEVYIMTAHWAYVIPIAMAFLLVRDGRGCRVCRVLIGLLAVYLALYNTWLFVDWTQQPIMLPPFLF